MLPVPPNPFSSMAPKNTNTKTTPSMKMPTRIVHQQLTKNTTLPSSSQASGARTKVVSEPKVSGHTTKTSQSVFERLYEHGTKASVGQQVESVRQKTMLKRQTNNNKPKPKSSTYSDLFKSSEVSSSADTAETQMTFPSNADGADSSDAKNDVVNTSLSNPSSQETTNSTPMTLDIESRCQTPERTPNTIFTAFSEDSSASTVSCLVGVESPTPSNLYFPHDDSATDPPRHDATLDVSLFSKWSSTSHGPWKMALKRKMEKDSERTAAVAEPLYLRSMANVLYDFANQHVSEAEVATELITALFHRDFESGKYWAEETAQVAAVQDGEYVVHKAAESSSILGGSTSRTVSSANIKIDYVKRKITVVDYYHGYSIIP
jgi:hypothetical protein